MAAARPHPAPDPGRPGRAVLACLLAAAGQAAAGEMPPGLPPAGQQAWADYRQAAEARAFAIAPGGSWAWRAGLDSQEQADDLALADCRGQTRQKCVLYASGRQTVFPAGQWPALWGPYADAATAGRAAAGSELGQRFPELAWRDAGGRAVRLGELRGKVVVLHFWGSWCPPCRKEMPEIAGLARQLAKRADIVVVPLQVRESLATATAWAARQVPGLALADSGSRGEADDQLRLAGGGSLADRVVARSFPTTYVLDKRGLVIFSHTGPLADWAGYAPFLLHAAQFSGR